METVSIRNMGKKPWTLILNHDQVCVAEGRCFCNGRLPRSIHLPAGVTTRDVPRAALNCADAKAAVNDLVVCATVTAVQDPVSAETSIDEKKVPGKGRKRQGSID